MVDTLTPTQRSERMGRVKSKGSKAELAVRSLVHRLGYRFRLHARNLPGHPDLVFASRRKTIFVHGCFWHRHQDEACKLARLPKSRRDFWLPKLEGNRQRDIRIEAALATMGWGVMVLWECELDNTESVSARIRTFLDS
jgi:DNA mismatch endonuclease (patch repair protein)